ncbi:hypothetical protein LCGC14_2806510, partial [marine sediment metagenome]
MDYVIWSHEHQAWWRPDCCGYTQEVSEAGKYTKAEAGNIVASATPHGIEVIVPVFSAE